MVNLRCFSRSSRIVQTRQVLARVVIVWLTALVVLACTNSAKPIVDVDQSTPVATVQSYLDAASRGDWQIVRALVKPGDKDSEAYLKRFEDFAKQGGHTQLSNAKIDVVEEGGPIARIRMSGHFKVFAGNGEVLSDFDTGDFFSLVKVDGRWYFVGLGQALPPGWIQQR